MIDFSSVHKKVVSNELRAELERRKEDVNKLSTQSKEYLNA